MAKQRTIAEQLRAEIAKAEKAGITQYKIAKDAGIDRSLMARVARGENIPRLDTAEKILAAINSRLTIVAN